MPDRPDADKQALDWGRAGPTSIPYTVRAEIGPAVVRIEGHAETVRDIYRRAGLNILLGNMILAITASLMLSIAAWMVVEAPPATASLVPWIAIPACVVAVALGGFAAFHIRASKSGFDISGGASPPRTRPRSR